MKNSYLRKPFFTVKTSTFKILCIVLLCSNILAAQNTDFLFFESRLQTLASKILSAETDSLKDEVNKLLIEDIEEVLLMKGSFQYKFESVDILSILA